MISIVDHPMAEDESTIFQTTAAAAATDDDDYDAEAVVTDAEAVVARPPPLLTQQEQQQEAKQQAQGRRKSRRISLRAMLEDGPGNDDDEEEDDFQYEGDDNAKNSKKSIIGMRETKAVFILKLIVVLVLILSATIVGTSTFLFLSRNEDQQFQLQYKEDAYKILEAMGSSLDKTLGLLDSVAVQLDSHATSQQQQQQESSSSWPFVTLPDFAVKLSKIFPLTDAIVVNVHPLVRNDQREAWENYAQNNNAWVDESMAVQAEWEGYYGPVTFNGTLNLTTLHSDFEDLPYNLTRDYLPLWQNFPVIANTTWTYNWDWFSFTYPEAYQTCIESHRAVVSAAFMTPEPGNPVAEAETQAWGEYYQDYLAPGEEAIEPMSDVAYPIIQGMATRVAAAGADGYDPANHTAVGIIVATMYWRSLIHNILPQGSNGIQVVFKMCSDDFFTYQIQGPAVVYDGVGDFHNKKYDSLALNVTLNDLGNFSTMRNAGYSGAPLISDFCNFTIQLYPSDVMKAAYTTNNPIIFTIVAIVIFAFTSLVFFLYDIMVERRQDTVMKTAVRSTAIVSSLFPSDVRDRIYPSPADKQPSGNTPQKFTLPENAAFGEGDKSVQPSPIAEMYPDTTVMFADIAGFTQWSSTRQPTQVFHLLESLYAVFDEIAKQRGVFKVETIGDCYLAVVGLPTPRKAHAIASVRFAAECRDAMQRLTVELEDTLGQGTADLALRIGLNSGPTTAGVLRGEKSRFQLFGDTVNTAARMESNGERNRIHISESTALLIKNAGKSHWLTRRDDQVYAKGKGLMTTFWCEPKFGSIKSSQRTSATTHISDSFASRNDDESKNLSFRDSSNNNNNIRPEEAPPELECPPPTTVYPSSDDSNVSDCEAMA